MADSDVVPATKVPLLHAHASKDTPEGHHAKGQAPRLPTHAIFYEQCRSQKNPRVRKILVRNSGAGNGCANFMDAWKNAFFLQEKPCP